MSDHAARSVTDELRSRIMEARLDAGTPLREVALAEEFGVSRIPVREALQTLTGEGFVISTPNVGSRVASPPYADAAELFDLRIVLEVALVRSAAERFRDDTEPGERSAALLAEVESSLCDGEQGVERRDARQIASANLHFHQGIALLAQRPVLSDLLQPIGSRIEWMHATHGGYTANRGSSTWTQHRRIFELVTDGAVEEAAEAMRDHLVRSRDAFLAGLADLPD